MRRVLLILGTVLVIAAAVVAVFLLTGNSKSSALPKLTPGKPVAATQAQLMEYEKKAGHPVYWIGAYKNFTYELTDTKKGTSFVRYLPTGVAVGDPSSKWTFVATIPHPEAYAETIIESKDTKQYSSHSLAYGGTAVWLKKHPTNIYLAYPKLKYLLEVYDPITSKAEKIVLANLIEPVSKPSAKAQAKSSK